MHSLGLSLLGVGICVGLGLGATRLRRPAASGALASRAWTAAWVTAQALLAAAAVSGLQAGLGALAADPELAPWLAPALRGEWVALVAVGLLLWLADPETPRSLRLAAAGGAAISSAGLSASLSSMALPFAPGPLAPDPLAAAVAAAALAPLLLSAAARGRLVAHMRAAATAVAGDDVVVLSRDGALLHASEAVRHKLKLSPGCRTAPPELARIVRDGQVRRARYRTRSGRVLEALGTPGRRRGPLARARGILIRDVTSRYRDEERLVHLAHSDSLTGLANRRLFLENLTHALEDARRAASLVGLLYIDLDDFKAVNDSLGHGAGDRLLEVVSERLRNGLLPEAVDGLGLGGGAVHAARLSGDEFAVVVPRLAEVQPLYELADRILDRLSQPVEIGERSLNPSASIGIAIGPEDGPDVDSLIRHADMALYAAKTRGRRRHARYEASLDASAERTRDVERGLRQAIERDELKLYYQPKVDVRTGTVGGLEALMRWKSAELGDVGPAEFIPIAERRGLVTELGTWALRRACRQIAEWRDAGLAVVSVAVNVSSHQFAEVDLQSVVSDALKEFDVDPHLLELELTESLLLDEGDHVELVLRDLRSIGVRIALDDFGTGYSALTYLNRFNLDVLKMDRGLLRDIDSNPSAEGIASAVVSMSHSLGLLVVAEGIDHPEQVPILREMGCDQIQGFLYSPALPPDEVVRYLARAGHEPPVCNAQAAPGSLPKPEVNAEEQDDAPVLRTAGPARRAAREASHEPLEVIEQEEYLGRVLMIDDASETLGPTALRLSRLGIDVHYASDTDEARLLLTQEADSIRAVALAPHVDLRFLQSLMTPLSGENGERRRLIVVGDRPDEDRRAAIREAGVDWVLWAPFNDAELRCLMRSGMAGSHQLADRREPRVPVDLVATISSGRRREVVVVSSLSPRGAFIEMNDPLPVGRSLRIEMQMPQDQFRGFARVVHVAKEDPSRPAEQSGMGVVFFGADRDTERILRKAVKELESRYLP